MGLRSSTFAIGWFITYFVLTIIPCALLAIASSYFGFFKYTSPATLFALVFLYVQSLLAFAFVVSTFFNSSKVMTSLPFVLHSYSSWPSQPIYLQTAGQVGGLLLLLLFLPSYAVNDATTYAGKVIAGFSSPIAFAQGFKVIITDDGITYCYTKFTQGAPVMVCIDYGGNRAQWW
jgi:hypothetical protein